MSINSIDAAVAGARPPIPLLKIGGTMEGAGILHSLFYSGGTPGAAAAPTPGLAGAALTSYAGQIPFANPVSGETRLMRFGGSASQAGKLVLADRLWHNSGIDATATGLQTINSVAFPARDRNGAANGVDILLGLEVRTATTNGTSVTTITASYTDQDNNAGATAAISSFPATAQAGTFVPFELATGDSGVRSVQSLTLGTSLGSGAVHLVAYRILAEVDMPAANVGRYIDIITGGAVALHDNSVPFLLWLPSSTTALSFSGTLVLAQG